MVSALSSAVRGLITSMDRMQSAAESIVVAGLPEAHVGPRDTAAGAGVPAGAGMSAADAAGATDVAGAMVDVLMAQRAFSAQLRVLRTADEMSRETMDLLKR